jgi:predicted RNA binding protein YcfA (HicA-like mRNA interferase family)
MTVKDKDLLKMLIKAGWYEERIHGGHHILVKDGKPCRCPYTAKI